MVASCTLTIIPNLTRACRPYGVIENVVTHTVHRGDGWGRALLQRTLAHAWRERCYKVMLMTGRKDAATLAAGLAEWTVLAGQVPAGGQVAVAGGCAMNAILMAQLRSHLERAGISLLEARQVPPNDGGLALGQAWLARQAASTR